MNAQQKIPYLPFTIQVWIAFNVALAVSTIYCYVGFSFFYIGGYPPMYPLCNIFLLGLLVIAPLTLVFMAFNFFCIVAPNLPRLFAWLPMTILAAGFTIAILLLWPTKWVVDNMFYYKAESYQQAADMIVAGKIPVNKSGGVSLPSQFRNLAWKTEVLQKETNSDAVFILFVTGHDQIYMYISTGIIEKGSGFDRRYRHQKKLKDKWFKVSH